MSDKNNSAQTTFQVRPIGRVRRVKDGVELHIDAAFRPALKELGGFSHVMVFWWISLFDNDEWRNKLQSAPPYAQDHVTGVFATRSPYRPNPIGMTTCKLLSVDETGGVVKVAELDAYDGTPIIDLKAYFPVCDRVKDARIPPWLVGWPEWFPEEGIGLQAEEADVSV